jgi:hypothetical protein
MDPPGEDRPLIVVRSKYELNGRYQEYITSFYADRMRIGYKDHKPTEIDYNEISRIAKRKECLRIDFRKGGSIEVPCDDGAKREIFRIFKMKKLGINWLNMKNITGIVLVEFADLNFLVPLFNNSFGSFREKVIKRIGGHFFPMQSMEFVTLDDYDEFAFYVKRGERLVVLENDEDLACALFYFERRLEVLIRHIPKDGG